MPDTGFLTPGSVTESGTGVAWVTPENSITDDGNLATLELGSFEEGNVLTWTSHGASISASSIDGIEVLFEHTTNVASGSATIYLTKDGTTVAGTSQGSLPSRGSLFEDTFGSPVNLWGTTWTESEVEASTFGVKIIAFGGDPGTISVNIDKVRVKIYYSEGSPWTPEQNSNRKIRVVTSGLAWR